MLYCTIILVGAFCQDKTAIEPGPSFRGTINIVAANDLGIVVLTDSMLTGTWIANGVLHSRQLPTPGQKLFLIDDRTVCAFAGFASADTSSLPDFLNSISAIMGRYQDRLRHIGPLSISAKLEELEVLLTYYLTGIANIRDGSKGEDYTFQLLLAGYDVDGTPKIGRLVLGTVVEPVRAGTLLKSVTNERNVFPITHRQMICVNGINNLALEILRSTNAWRADPAVPACEQSASDQELLSIEQMKALAISLKQRTADQYPQVGGPNQIAVLTNGRVLQPVDQPPFPPITPSEFTFRIISGQKVDGGDPRKPILYGIVMNGYVGLYFKNEFIHVKQELDNTYYGANTFRDCILTYRGGKTRFEKSNEVVDSDLEIAAGVSRDSQEVKQLLHDFKWRAVKYPGNDQSLQTQLIKPDRRVHSLLDGKAAQHFRLNIEKFRGQTFDIRFCSTADSETRDLYLRLDTELSAAGWQPNEVKPWLGCTVGIIVNLDPKASKTATDAATILAQALFEIGLTEAPVRPLESRKPSPGELILSPSSVDTVLILVGSHP